MSRTGPPRKQLSRRQYLKTTAATGALCFAPTIIPARALGRDGATAPSERIVIGRNRHRQPRRVRPEVDAPRKGRPVRRHLRRPQGASPGRQANRRQALRLHRLPDVSGDGRIPRHSATTSTRVLIATGDRWHSLAACLAMRAGKDVYSEKPSCMTIAEGRDRGRDSPALRTHLPDGCAAALRGPFVTAIELARSGRLGQIQTVHAHIAPWDAAEMSHAWLPEEPQPSKEEVDWDAWLGPCPWRPYNSTYVRGGWRGHYDFHTSCIGEWGAHSFRPVPGRHRRVDHFGRRIPLRQERHRRRHGHQVRQWRPDDPLPRR